MVRLRCIHWFCCFMYCTCHVSLGTIWLDCFCILCSFVMFLQNKAFIFICDNFMENVAQCFALSLWLWLFVVPVLYLMTETEVQKDFSSVTFALCCDTVCEFSWEIWSTATSENVTCFVHKISMFCAFVACCVTMHLWRLVPGRLIAVLHGTILHSFRQFRTSLTRVRQWWNCGINKVHSETGVFLAKNNLEKWMPDIFFALKTSDTRGWWVCKFHRLCGSWKFWKGGWDTGSILFKTSKHLNQSLFILGTRVKNISQLFCFAHFPENFFSQCFSPGVMRCCVCVGRSGRRRSTGHRGARLRGRASAPTPRWARSCAAGPEARAPRRRRRLAAAAPAALTAPPAGSATAPAPGPASSAQVRAECKVSGSVSVVKELESVVTFFCPPGKQKGCHPCRDFRSKSVPTLSSWKRSTKDKIHFGHLLV